jgi:hypothetical protein
MRRKSGSAASVKLEVWENISKGTNLKTAAAS